MDNERIKEELKLHIEVFKFFLVVLLALVGGIITLLNIDSSTHNQETLIGVGCIFTIGLIFGIAAHFVHLFVIKQIEIR